MSFLTRLFQFLASLFARAPLTSRSAPAAPLPTAARTSPAPSGASGLKALSPDELRAKYSTSSAPPAPKPAPPVAPKPAPPVAPKPAPQPKPISAPVPGRSLESVFDDVGRRVGVDPNLLRALATVESSYGRNLHSAGSPSYGVMQINCGSGLGADQPCTRKLAAGFMRDWPATPRRLLEDHDYNVELGARLLKDELRQARGDVVLAIAGYNVGGPRLRKAMGDGKKIPEQIDAEKPRQYVLNVLAEWRRRGGPDLSGHAAIA